MSLILAFSQLLCIIGITFFEYWKRSIAVFLWAMLFVLFGSVHFFTVLRDVKEYPEWVYDNASLFTIGFCVCYIITRVLFHPKGKSIKFQNWRYVDPLEMSKKQKLFIHFTFGILIFSVFYKIYSIASFSGGLLDSSWSTGRELSASREYFNSGQIVTCMYYYSASSVLLFIYWKQKKMAIISGLLVCFCVIVSRNRMDVLPLLIAVISYYIYNGDRLTFKRILFFLLLGCFSVISIYALQIFRYYGSILAFVDNFEYNEFSQRVLVNIMEGKGDIGLRDVFYYFIYNDNKFENFGLGHTYIRMFLVLIPTQWSMGLKPPDFAISMGTALRTGIDGLSTHPTLFGNCYANFGYAGFLMGIFWAFFVCLLDKIVSGKDVNLKIAFVVLFGSVYVIMGRGSVYNPFIWAFYGTIIMFLIHAICKKMSYVSTAR